MPLPQDKLAKLHNLVDMMATQRAVGDIESLVGHLVHASKVCPFSNLFAVLSSMKAGQFRRLNLVARADLGWWQALLAFFHFHPPVPDFTATQFPSIV